MAGKISQALTRHRAALCRVLRHTRHDANLTTRDLAARLNWNQPAVVNIESGERRLELTEFVALARALDRDPLELFGEILRELDRLPKPRF